VPATELARLAERGYRGDAARTRSPDGQGLGLHIAWRVAELHELDLRFAPSEHGGLEVTLEGPAIASA
jgi:signal transduction histidine kinase